MNATFAVNGWPNAETGNFLLLPFCKGDRTTGLYSRKNKWGHVLGDFGQTLSISDSTEDETWLDLPA